MPKTRDIPLDAVYSPEILDNGEHKLTVSWTDENGKDKQEITITHKSENVENSVETHEYTRMEFYEDGKLTDAYERDFDPESYSFHQVNFDENGDISGSTEFRQSDVIEYSQNYGYIHCTIDYDVDGNVTQITSNQNDYYDIFTGQNYNGSMDFSTITTKFDEEGNVVEQIHTYYDDSETGERTDGIIFTENGEQIISSSFEKYGFSSDDGPVSYAYTSDSASITYEYEDENRDYDEDKDSWIHKTVTYEYDKVNDDVTVTRAERIYDYGKENVEIKSVESYSSYEEFSDKHYRPELLLHEPQANLQEIFVVNEDLSIDVLEPYINENGKIDMETVAHHERNVEFKESGSVDTETHITTVWDENGEEHKFEVKEYFAEVVDNKGYDYLVDKMRQITGRHYGAYEKIELYKDGELSRTMSVGDYFDKRLSFEDFENNDNKNDIEQHTEDEQFDDIDSIDVDDTDITDDDIDDDYDLVD